MEYRPNDNYGKYPPQEPGLYSFLTPRNRNVSYVEETNNNDSLSRRPSFKIFMKTVERTLSLDLEKRGKTKIGEIKELTF